MIQEAHFKSFRNLVKEYQILTTDVHIAVNVTIILQL